MNRLILILSLSGALFSLGLSTAAKPKPVSVPQRVNPPVAAVSEMIMRQAKAHRIPSVLVMALAYRWSRWNQFDATGIPIDNDGHIGILGVPLKGRVDADKLKNDWQYNIEQGVRFLEICWNRAPIMGSASLEDGRNILESWYFALGRYGVGKEGLEANAFAETVLDTLSQGGNGAFEAVSVSRPDKARVSVASRNYIGTPTPWHFGDVTPHPPIEMVVRLDVPYFNQIVDVPDNFDGSGSCGPSSMLMVLAFYKKLPHKPVTTAASFTHVSPYGGILPEIDGKVCDPNLGAVHAWMLDYLRPLFPNVAIFYDQKATFARVKAELDAGRPVILGTQVTPAGHLMVARGYLKDGRLLCNDPAGNQTLMSRKGGVGAFSPTGNRYWNYEGNGAVYDWDALDVRWVMVFEGGSGDKAEDEDMKRPETPRNRTK